MGVTLQEGDYWVIINCLKQWSNSTYW